MRLLLDTHIFLWFISGASQLAAALRDDLTMVMVDGSIRAYPVSVLDVSR